MWTLDPNSNKVGASVQALHSHLSSSVGCLPYSLFLTWYFTSFFWLLSQPSAYAKQFLCFPSLLYVFTSIYLYYISLNRFLQNIHFQLYNLYTQSIFVRKKCHSTPYPVLQNIMNRTVESSGKLRIIRLHTTFLSC